MPKIIKNGIEYGGGTAVVPIASASTLGAIKVGRGLSIDPVTGVLNRDDTPIAYTALGDVTNVDLTFDRTNHSVSLKWDDPVDVHTSNNEGYLAQWEETVVVRKSGSPPANVNDGVIVCRNTVRDKYSPQSIDTFVDSTCYDFDTAPVYYGFFPKTTEGFYTKSISKIAQLEIIVPQMTSATAPEGEVKVTSQEGSHPGWHAFNRTNGRFWGATSKSSGQYIEYDFASGKKVTPTRVTFYPLSYSYVKTTNFKVQLWDIDNSQWVDVTGTVSYTTTSSVKYANENSVLVDVDFTNQTFETNKIRLYFVSTEWAYNAGLLNVYGYSLNS